jgi:hypothetical protein
LWFNHREPRSLNFRCPLCGARFGICIHREEIAAVVLVLFLIFALPTVAHAHESLLWATVIVVAFAPLIGSIIMLITMRLLRDRQRYRRMEHAV